MTNYLLSILFTLLLALPAIYQLHLDLKAEVPGVYQAPASSAYLYYTNEYKDWEAGEKVEIIP